MEAQVMTWSSHKLTTAAIAYALGLPVEGIVFATAASTYTDAIEFVLRLRHRGISHFWGIYLTLFLVAHFNLLNFNLTPPIPFLLEWLEWFALGCLLHLFEDAMSKSGIGLFPYSTRKIKLGELYVTGQISEYLVAFAIVAVCLGIKAWLVHTGQAVWKPEITLLRQLKIFFR